MARFLIIAASSGIGQAVVSQLKTTGHTAVTTARDRRKIDPDYILDASDFRAMDQIFQSCGPIEGVVNCSGSLLLKPVHLTTQDQFDDVITASLKTAFATVRSAGKYMTQGGSVVLISSAAAMTGLASHEAIAAAKGGIISLTQSAAAAYAGNNLRVNAVAPGLVETPLTAALTASETARKMSKGMHALGRIGRAQDVARMISFLLVPENDWITGQIIGVDGGLSNVRPKPRV